MITVAVATRTMDRQARYRSLLPAQDFTIVSALDCPTLAQLAKTRPVDVIVFDIQRPAMPAEDWLDIIDQDPDLRSLPVAWVGRDVPSAVFEKVRAAAICEVVPPRPDAQILIGVILRLAAICRSAPGVSRQAGQVGWQPGEDIIDDALRIFDQSAENASPDILTHSQKEWLVSELVGRRPKGRENRPESNGIGAEEEAPLAKNGPTEESSITLDSEEIGTGKFVVMPGQKNSTTHPGVINEKIMGITTRPGQRLTGPELVEQITREILGKLAAQLADELVARIDYDLVRRMVEEKLTVPDSVPPPDTNAPAS